MNIRAVGILAAKYLMIKQVIVLSYEGVISKPQEQINNFGRTNKQTLLSQFPNSCVIWNLYAGPFCPLYTIT